MNWRRWREIGFPMLAPFTAQEETEFSAALERDTESIENSKWKLQGDVALEEARRLADAEAERWRVADQKASTYLAVVAALVPLLLTVTTTIWDGRAGSAPTWLNMILLGLAVVYVAAAGWWAFKVLEVAAANRVGAGDLVAAWRETSPREELIRQILTCARLNQPRVNAKISRIKMTHAFLLRAFLTFAALLLFNIGWFLARQAVPARPAVVAGPRSTNPWTATAANRARAVAAIEDLRRQLRTSHSATAVLDHWCQVHDMAPAGAVAADKLADRDVPSSPALRRLLRIGPGEPLGMRHVRLRCRDHLLSEAVLWYVPARLPAPINRQLRRTDVPFGRAVAPLGVRRLILSSRRSWPPAAVDDFAAPMPQNLFEETALLTLLGGQPVAYVRESYKSGILGFPPS